MRTCLTCLNAGFDPGSPGGRLEPPDPGGFWCNHEVHAEELMELGDGMETYAEVCTGYTPRMLVLCAECGGPLVVPEESWDLWYDGLAICTEDCRIQLIQRRTLSESEMGGPFDESYDIQ